MMEFLQMLVASSDNPGLCPMSFSEAGNLSDFLVLKQLQYQRKTGRYCDAEIVVEPRVFAAHRNVLAAASPYFDAIFKHVKVTKEQVKVRGCRPESFEAFLNYMYSGTLVINRSTVTELLRLGTNFMCIKLKNYCMEYLDRYMDSANCLSIRTLAQRYNLPALVTSATHFFDRNLNRCLLESVDIIGYTYTQLTRLLQDPKYVDVIQMDTYLKLIIRWVGENIAEREPIFRLLLEQCQMSEVSTDSLEFLLDYAPLLQKSQKSRYLMLHVMEANNLMREKYASQLTTLRQKIGELPPLHDSAQFEDDYESSESEEYEEDGAVEGQPTSAQIIEYGNDMNQKLKMKIQLGTTAKRLKRPRRNKPAPQIDRSRDAPENESIPWIDEDGLDGVFATSSLEGTHTYGPPDNLDPDDCDDDDDVPDENGTAVCNFCGLRTTNEELLDKHKARYHNRNTFYLCHLCEFETNWSKQYYLHCHEHWPNLPYRCDACQYTSTSLQEFLTHRLVHTEERYFKCGECAWKGRTRSQLFAHERMHSILDDRTLHCEECGRGFQTHAALDHHINTHNDMRPFVCEDCGFQTKTADYLSMHRRQHSGDNYNCHIAGCEYSSTKKSQLAAHLRTHMAVRAHGCKICGRGFIEKSHLVRHERIHLEEKPFKCDQCEYASSRRDKLKEHIIKHHNSGGDVAFTHKTQRRKNKRQRMLVAASNIVASAHNPDALFRPVTKDDAVEAWTRNNDFSRYSPSTPNEFGAASSSAFHHHHHQQQQQPSSPPRAFSVVHSSGVLPPPQPSPGGMSMMNIPLRDTQHLMAPEVLSNSMDRGLVTPNQLPMPEPHDHLARQHDNRSVVPQFNALPSSSAIRPISLPNYQQMEAQLLQQLQLQQQQQQQPGPSNSQALPPPNQWNPWNMQ